MIPTFYKADRLKAAAFPLIGGVVGGLVGGPVGLVAGLKLGGMAAIGGGIAGSYLKTVSSIDRSVLRKMYSAEWCGEGIHRWRDSYP